MLLSTQPAWAGIFELYGQVQGGAGLGGGIEVKDPDPSFFAHTAGGAYGFLMGGEVFFVDGWIEHNQYLDGDGVAGTWTQFMLGMDTAFSLGDPAPGAQPRHFAEVGMAVGMGVGTPRQVDLPLDNDQVSDKGFLAQLSLGVEFKLTKLLSMGLAVPITYGYLIKNDSLVENVDEHYQSISVAPMLHLRAHIDVR